MTTTDELKNKRTLAKSQFTRTERRLKDVIKEVVPSSIIVKRLEELTIKWDTVQQMHDEYVLSVTATNPEDTTAQATEEQWITELEDRYSALEIEAHRRIEKDKMTQAEESRKNKEENLVHDNLFETSLREEGVFGNQVQLMAGVPQLGAVQLERIKIEKFQGNLRKYPKFKEQFEKYVKPLCQDAQLPFILRAHLSDDVKEEVDDVDDDIVTLWKRLDYKYGNRDKQIEMILADISRMPKGDAKNTLTMINTVEKAHRDLARMNRASEMENGTIISMIEKKLPEDIRVDWIKKIAEEQDTSDPSQDISVDAVGKFNMLLELLKKWRRIIEYDQATIRKTTEKKGLAHHVKATENKERGEPCWIHKESGGHPIWACKVFKDKPVNERIALADKVKACHACLEVKCPGANNPDNCRKEFRCIIDGCEIKHNKLLHL